jgi:hypothetical protein
MKLTPANVIARLAFTHVFGIKGGRRYALTEANGSYGSRR